LEKNEPWYKIPLQKPFLSIHIQDPITINNLIQDDLGLRESTRALNMSLKNYFEEELT
jgi:hypothetical protein